MSASVFKFRPTRACNSPTFKISRFRPLKSAGKFAIFGSDTATMTKARRSSAHPAAIAPHSRRVNSNPATTRRAAARCAAHWRNHSGVCCAHIHVRQRQHHFARIVQNSGVGAAVHTGTAKQPPVSTPQSRNALQQVRTGGILANGGQQLRRSAEPRQILRHIARHAPKVSCTRTGFDVPICNGDVVRILRSIFAPPMQTIGRCACGNTYARPKNQPLARECRDVSGHRRTRNADLLRQLLLRQIGLR